MCLLVPPAGQGQERQGCPGRHTAPLDYCLPPQMMTAAGLSALRNRKESGEMNGGMNTGKNAGNPQRVTSKKIKEEFCTRRQIQLLLLHVYLPSDINFHLNIEL